MHLSIRWKFILSIGITLIVTYLGLLTWDYLWQRSNAAAEMRQHVVERAEAEASRQNERFAGWESQIAAISNALERNQPQSADQLRAVPSLRTLAPRGGVQIVVAFEPEFAAAAKLDTAYQVEAVGGGGQPGGRGNTGGPNRGGGGRGGQGGRGQQDGRGNFEGRSRGPGGGPGGPPPDFMPPDMVGTGGAPLDAGGPRNFPQLAAAGIQVTELQDFDRAKEPLYARAIEAKRAVWSDPHEIKARLIGAGAPGAGQLRVTYSVPIVINDRIVGVVAAVMPPQFGGFGNNFGRGGRGGRGGNPGPGPQEPSTRPFGDEFDGMVREFSIIGNEGKVIYPVQPNAKRESIVEWAKANGMPDLAEDLRATFEGENQAAKVYRVHDAPDIVPGAKAGEYYWVAFAPIATTDWVVTSAISESEHMSPIIQRLWHRALFLIGGLVVLLGMTTFISIRVSRPIEKMARAVNELAHGNLDAHVTEVDSRDELGQLAGAFNTMTGQLKQHIAALTEQTAARETVEAELRIARQIQTDLLPKTFPPFPNRREFTLHAINVPAHRVAGDFYDFFFASADLLTVVIADVSGKGVPAALLMAVTRTIVRNLAMEGLSPSQIAERANAMLIQDISDSMFVTMFLCLYDTKTGMIVYVNAGHPKPYRFGPTGEPQPFGDITGALLGVCPSGPDWQYEQHEAQLEVGQTLLLYTDGVTEARAPDGSMLRNEGVELLIKKHQAEPVATLCNSFVQELNEYQAGQPADDITLVALERVA